MFCIYLIFNVINGKIYVGKSQDFSKRFRDHLKIARGGKKKYPGSYSYIHAAMNKYGYDNFIIKMVEKDISDENLAFTKEKEWIEMFRNNKYPIYNLTDGGDGVTGRKATEEQKKKQSERQKGSVPWNKGKKTSEIVREKQSISAINRFKNGVHPRTGKLSHFKGKKRPAEFGEKISQYKRGIPKSKEHILATSKLTEEQVREIKKLIKQGMQNKNIAILFNVYRDTVSRIKNNKTWSWVD